MATMLQSEAGRRPRGVLGILGASSLIQWACMLLGAAVLLFEYLIYGREVSALLRVIRAHMDRSGERAA